MLLWLPHSADAMGFEQRLSLLMQHCVVYADSGKKKTITDLSPQGYNTRRGLQGRFTSSTSGNTSQGFSSGTVTYGPVCNISFSSGTVTFSNAKQLQAKFEKASEKVMNQLGYKKHARKTKRGKTEYYWRNGQSLIRMSPIGRYDSVNRIGIFDVEIREEWRVKVKS
ncbi:hypothetical protein J7426_11805 [Tropicibacter sp. R16_0]|uniref:hypothetical protein n=1 Tax=Tropicibacter sp. R16_0 TaxID=2821102 RepID=UPI001ADC76DC|nr:hypothetical protein [Tropicibacter sp. R16_0]MBO9450949.1 hypothetical protein [Tropicibacter sp. R16_0]